MLYAYLGDITFNKIAQEHISSNTSKRENINFLANNLPNFLKHAQNFEHNPEIFELACLEVAINKAFVAPETSLVTSLNANDAQLQKTKFNFVKSAQLLLFNQNTTSLWAALKCGEKPPRPHKLDKPQHVLVWRQHGASRFRILGEEEANLFQCFDQKANIRTVIKKNSEHLGQELAAQHILNYLRGWLDAELIAATF